LELAGGTEGTLDIHAMIIFSLYAHCANFVTSLHSLRTHQVVAKKRQFMLHDEQNGQIKTPNIWLIINRQLKINNIKTYFHI
jgi:hypothetical protein